VRDNTSTRTHPHFSFKTIFAAGDLACLGSLPRICTSLAAEKQAATAARLFPPAWCHRQVAQLPTIWPLGSKILDWVLDSRPFLLLSLKWLERRFSSSIALASIRYHSITPNFQDVDAQLVRIYSEGDSNSYKLHRAATIEVRSSLKRPWYVTSSSTRSERPQVFCLQNTASPQDDWNATNTSCSTNTIVQMVHLNEPVHTTTNLRFSPIIPKSNSTAECLHRHLERAEVESLGLTIDSHLQCL
jgi:hypothetical protein